MSTNAFAQEEQPEPLLSPELAAELGCDGTDVVLTGSKKKSKKDGTEEVSEEVKTLAKQLSKKAQKRIAQIARRKETEAKRSDFLDIIHEHEISDQQRQLLTSTRDINQTQTLKQLLSTLYKKQAAGVALTMEEKRVLYSQPDEDGNGEAPQLVHPPQNHGEQPRTIFDSTMPTADASEGAVVTIDDIFGPSSCEPLPKGKNSKKKKDKKAQKPSFEDISIWEPSAPKAPVVKDTARVAPAAAPTTGTGSLTQSAQSNPAAPAAPAPTKVAPSVESVQQEASKPAEPAKKGSVGSGLLAQLQLLKAGKSGSGVVKTSAKPVSVANEAAASASTGASTSGAGGADKGVYEARPVELPVSAQGEVVVKRPAAPITATGVEGEGPGTTSGGPSSGEGSAARKTAVKVFRSAEVQAARMELPVCGMEQEIVEAVTTAENDAVILCGETGSGKSTQVPQFLYEAGYAEGGLIGITQPRRVAVTSTAQRVAYEMTSGLPQPSDNDAKNGKKNKKKDVSKTGSDDTETDAKQRQGLGQLVGYQIRFDSATVGPDTRIKFMTDGILLKEVAADLLLRKYRVVILDEAHERNMNTDVLLGMLSKVLPLRRAQAKLEQDRYAALSPEDRASYAPPLQPLKLIIMSATMRVGDFQSPTLFPAGLPPVIKVDARQYPVTTHFSKRTEVKNYLKETHKKVCQIHRKLPEGGVLVFLTGKQEILYMCHKLNKSLNKRTGKRGGADKAVTAEDAALVPEAAASEAAATEAAGLGASAEELMELQEDAQLLHGSDSEEDGEGARGKGGKGKGNRKSKKGGNSGDGEGADRAARVRELLGQDEIPSDSDIDEGGSDAGDDSDMEVSDGEGSDAAGRDGGVDEEGQELTAEEALFVLDGDDNCDKVTTRGASGVGGADLAARIASSAQGLAEGDAVRAQMLREALGVDPLSLQSNTALIAEPQLDATATATAVGASTQPSATHPEDMAEPPALRAWVLPLYALMPAAQQNRVFLPPPPGHRLIVVATNVAETSITIPGIRYVVDSGRQKERVITSAAPVSDEQDGAQPGGKRAFEGTKVIPNDLVAAAGGAIGAGIAKYEVKWVAQAGAEQRKGRAGRTGPGHCYRLYSANFYHHYLQPYQPPEITVTPLEELILQMKALGIDHIERFPFPTPPPAQAVRNALTLLTNLGAIAVAGTSTSSALTPAGKKSTGPSDLTAAIAMATMHAMQSKTPLAQRQLQQLQELHRQQQQARDLCPLTPLGRMLARFPINPRFAKMLVMAFRASGMIAATAKDGRSAAPSLAVLREKYALLSHALTLVATLAERSAFEGVGESLPGEGKKTKQKRLTDGKAAAGQDGSESDSDSDTGEDLAAAQSEELRRQGSLFHHEDGDTLARLRATGAYVHTVTAHLHSEDKKGVNRKLSKAAVVAANEAPSVRALCSVHRLHAPTLQRIVELRDQLQDIAASVLLSDAPAKGAEQGSGGKTAVDDGAVDQKAALAVPLLPPSPAQELALRQLIVSGFCDSIARKAPLGVVKTGNRRRRLTAYFSSHPALKDVPLYLHPGSNLFRKDPTAELPEFVSYGALVRNQRGDCIYMTCVTTVSPAWLASVAADCPLLRWSAPLASPAPYYDASADAVMCYVTPRFGAHNWELSAMKRPLYDCTALGADGDGAASAAVTGAPLGYRKQDEVYRWFGKLLLEGAAFASSSQVVGSNLAREMRSALNKSKLKDGSAAVVIQMKPIPKVSNLLRKLVTREVRSVGALLQLLRADPSFLSEELLEFLLPEARSEFRAAWLRLAASAKAAK